jgi:hypothetical protein
MPMFRRASTMAAVATLALAGVPAAGAATRATVLSVHAHSLRVVTARQQARTFHVAGRVPRGLRIGSRVAFTTRRGTARHLRVLPGRASVFHVRGVARRVRRGSVAVRLADGGSLVVGGVTLTLVGFAPGQHVDVTVTISAAGDVNVIVRLVDGPCGDACPLAVEGHVTAVGTGTLSVDAEDGGAGYSFAVADAGALDGIAVGDEVVVFAHAADGGYVADRIVLKRHDGVGGGDGGHRDVYGRIVAIDAGAGFFGIARPGGDGESHDVYADADTLAGLAVGDVVHAVVHRDGDGHWVAESVKKLTPPPAPPALEIVATLRDVEADHVVIGSADGTGHGLSLWFDPASPPASLGDLAIGSTVRVDAHRDAPEHWVLDAIAAAGPPAT